LRFVVDCMLGSLAKWLKILGLDTRYDPALDDDDLVEIADRQDRILVTRDSRLVRRRRLREPIFIVSQDLHEQIHQVLREKNIKINPGLLLSRCLDCNRPTENVPREAVRDLVPAYVYRTQEKFSRCPACGKTYWQATHVTRMLERLRKEFRIPLPGGGN